MEEAGVRLVAEGASQFNQQIDRAAKGVDDFGKNSSSAAGGVDLMSVATVALGSALGDLALRGLDAATNAITGFIKTGFDYNKSIENATAQLVAFTGSQEAAAEALDLVERKAASTPFAFDEMAQSAASLAATSRSTGESLESLLDLATRLAASNPAEGLEGAAFALREAFSGDFMSLQERFNISKDTVARLKEMGVTTENLSSVFNELGITTGLVTGLAETFDGRMSTLIDTVTKLAGAFTAPIFDLFSGWIADVQIGLDANIVSWQTWATSVGQSVADSFQTAKEAWLGEWQDDEIIQPVHRFVGNTTLAVKGMWDKLVAFGIENKPKLDAIWNGFITNIASLETAWTPLNTLFNEGGRLISEIEKALNAVNGAITVGNPFWGEMNEKMEGANTLGDNLAKIFNGLADVFKRVADWIAKVRQRFQELFDFFSSIDSNALQTMVTLGMVGLEQVMGQESNIPTTGAPGGGANSQGEIVPIPPPNKASSPRSASGGGVMNRTNVVINPVVNIPAGVSPATATKIVTDGVLAAQRSRGMA